MVVFRRATLASLIAVSNPMGPPAPPPSTYGCGGGVTTLPCAVAVGPIPAQVPVGVTGPYSSSTSGGAVKPHMTSNGYVAMTPRPPSQAAMPATLVPQVCDLTHFAFYYCNRITA